jgi:hypothetical protein
MYVQYHAFKTRTDGANPHHTVFYALCVLYVLSVAIIPLEIAIVIFVSNNE